MKTRKWFILLAAAVAGGLLALAAERYFNRHEYKGNHEFSRVIAENQSPQAPYRFTHYSPGSEQSTDFTLAAEKSVNAVVHVKTLHEGQVYRYFDPSDFFWGGGYREYRTPPQMGTGSGVIVTGNGYIITNNHVIQGADKVEVTLNDQRTFIAKVVGTDLSTDLALLKVEHSGLPYLEYGNSDEVKIGEWVLAVGNPYNLTSTVTAGIVSAKGRAIGVLRQHIPAAIESYIQTDAAVNPGNSGGALVNTRGELIGINSVIVSPTGTYTGYSFAIPVNLVRKVVADLIEYGEVQHAYIGVTIQNMDEELAGRLNMNEIKGVYVNGLAEDGAAKSAGIKTGDVITEIQGISVNTVPELQEQVGKYRPGDKINIILLRDGRQLDVSVVLTNKLGKPTGISEASISSEEAQYIESLGAGLERASANELKKLNLESGVKIIKLERGKLFSAGIREGFIITKVDKASVQSPSDIAGILKNKKGGTLIEGVYPNGTKGYYGFGM